MEYGKAQDIRKKGLAGLITDNLVKGDSISSSFGSAISDRTQATITGLQETFDPLNIAKFLTGGSKLAPALLGRMTGRKQSTIEYFAGKKTQKSAFRGVNTETGETLNENFAEEILGLIYEELKRAEDNRQLLEASKKEEDLEEERRIDERNKAIIEALTARKEKKETNKEKAEKKRQEKRKKRKQKRTEEKQKKKETSDKEKAKKEETTTKKEQQKTETKTKKEEAAKKAEAPPAPKPEVKPPVKEAPKPEVPPAAKPEVKPPAKEVPKPEAPPTPKEAPKPEVKPPAKEVPKPEVKKEPTAAPAKPTKPPVTKVLPPVSGGKGLVIAALVAAGLSSKALANVLAQVQSESNFVPKSESLFYTSAKGIMNTFGRNRIPSEEFAQQFVSKKGDDRSEQLANYVYAKTDGNSAPGDGWKYRGRGFLQITGKNAYKSLGDYLKVDLVSNPDLLNSPEIAAKSIPWFFLNYKRNLTNGDPKSLENISLVNRAVGFSDPTGEKAKKREALASEFENQNLNVETPVNTGSQIDQSSKENRDLKTTNKEDKPAPITNNTSVSQTTKMAPKKDVKKEDDRPVIFEKLRN